MDIEIFKEAGIMTLKAMEFLLFIACIMSSLIFGGILLFDSHVKIYHRILGLFLIIITLYLVCVACLYLNFQHPLSISN